KNEKRQTFVYLFCPKSTMNLTYLCYGIVKYSILSELKARGFLLLDKMNIILDKKPKMLKNNPLFNIIQNSTPL
ncbi:MAG: hypothetical protein KUG68_07685, partial [Flavobacteriaceae bacterium]|nr:hypothetical protein [Flavobacteriaceae bacterium]